VKDIVKIKETGKTQMMENRQTTGEKGRKLFGSHDLTRLPPYSITNYELRGTGHRPVLFI
jgi:hypothetical protein